MKDKTMLSVGMMVIVISIFFNSAYGHGVGFSIFSGSLRIEDESFSAQSINTEDRLLITGKLVSLVDYPQQLEMSMLVTTDQFQTLSASTIIHSLQYGIQRDYQEHDDWFFQTVAEPDKITLEPSETVEYKITTVLLKAGTYHVHTQVTSDNGSKLGPGQTITVDGSSDITMGELFGIHLRFAVLVLLAITGILMVRKIISKRRKLRLENEK